MLLRARVVSFLSGFAVAGSFALYQLRQDIWESYSLLSSQAGLGSKELESRVSALEAEFARLHKAQ